MVSIEIDNHIYQVPEGTNLLQACLSLGLNLPYFCWHPAMGSVGACRQCAVIQYHDEHVEGEGVHRDEQGRVVMSCMTPVSEGMRISIEAPDARDFRSDIIELLMTNHPHDCPVCEEGGECHLQDMTEMSGHTFRKYRGTKRTHTNQYLGPFINHEMNRCIACYRCVRYYQDYAGGHDLQAMASHNHVYFGRHEDGVLENEFSGNLVEVCPTGVFTDKTLSQRYSRKWDLQTAPSICVHCAQGCNTSPGERYGELRRVTNRYNSEINGYFLCDRGRFGYGFVNRDDRPKKAVQRKLDADNNPLQDVLSRSETRDLLAAMMDKDQRLVGIGSPRASVEANYALRELVGRDNFYTGLDAQNHQLHQLVIKILRSRPVTVPTLAEVEKADAVLVLGEDVLNTSPRLALSLRQTAANAAYKIADELRIPHWQDAAVREAAQTAKTPIYLATVTATGIDDIAEKTYRSHPQGIAQLGFAIACAINPESPFPEHLSEQQQTLAQEIAAVLKQAKNPLIVSGTGCLNKAVIKAAANVATALTRNRDEEEAATDIVYCLPESNSMGLGLMAAADQTGHLGDALEVLDSGAADTVILLENDLSYRLPPDQIERIYKAGNRVVLLDHRQSSHAANVDLVLPAATYAESGGTLISAEGRAQRYFPVYVPTEDIRASWEWLSDMSALRHGDPQAPWQHLEQLTQRCAEDIPGLGGIVNAAPAADFRMEGMKVARQPHRYSGRTAMLADQRVSEPKQPEDPDSPLGYTMEGFPGQKPPALTPYYWAPGWNSNQSVGKFQQEINGPLKGGDPGERLIELSPRASVQWFEAGVEASERAGQWLLLPAYHIFGSEELSALTAPIAERSPQPYILLGQEHANTLQVTPGDGVRVASGSQETVLEVGVDAQCPAGAVIVPVGLAQTAGLSFMDFVSVTKDESWVRRPEASLIASDNGGKQ